MDEMKAEKHFPYKWSLEFIFDSNNPLEAFVKSCCVIYVWMVKP
jgi:hypothetical protein